VPDLAEIGVKRILSRREFAFTRGSPGGRGFPFLARASAGGRRLEATGGALLRFGALTLRVQIQSPQRIHCA
jgi:hypothetical protein